MISSFQIFKSICAYIVNTNLESRQLEGTASTLRVWILQRLWLSRQNRTWIQATGVRVFAPWDLAHKQFLTTARKKHNWLVVYLPLWNTWKTVPSHQPASNDKKTSTCSIYVQHDQCQNMSNVEGIAPIQHIRAAKKEWIVHSTETQWNMSNQ